ncbi:MAG: hypothetical protein EHM20_09985 [Alphaproteobacteria bacterium]|nr:MAG: hypothetical protein EHM20_09985 [Alphaproteobacteria bacterium]
MSAAREIKLQAPAPDEDFKVDSTSDKLAGYFYKIANHEELFKIGRGFLKEVENGVGSFAFTSTGYKNSQQRTILGLCCFFDQNANYKIAIISDHLTQGVFGDLVDSSSLNSYPVGNGQDVVNYKSFHHHFDFIDYSEFIKFYENHLYTKSFDEEVAKILKNYDIVLWDVPEMEKVKEHPHFHYRISHFYESMTVIISQYASTGKHIESIKNFFSNYNINLNKVLFDTWETREQPKRKKFLGIF